MPSYRYGTNRGVLLCDSMALKFALHERGARCNLFEARTYASSTGDRRAGLCPVLWCSHNGAVLAMAYATPIPEEEFEMLPDDAFPTGSMCRGRLARHLNTIRQRTGVG